jgi:hypothetical protein
MMLSNCVYGYAHPSQASDYAKLTMMNVIARGLEDEYGGKRGHHGALQAVFGLRLGTSAATADRDGNSLAPIWPEMRSAA